VEDDYDEIMDMRLGEIESVLAENSRQNLDEQFVLTQKIMDILPGEEQTSDNLLSMVHLIAAGLRSISEKVPA
jgi:hypothetical protein